jgi:hypothetical protein
MGKWIVLAIAVVAALIWLFLQNRSEVDLSRPIRRAGEVATQAAPAPTAPPTATQATPTPTPSPSPTASPTPPPPRPTADARPARIAALAPGSGVQLRGFQPEGAGAWLEVSWPGDDTTLGADFLGVLVREGVIRDFDVNRTHLGASMQDGRRYWIGRYYVLF